MVDKNSSPAFSLGTSKRKQLKDNGMPGPGSYASFTSLKSPKGNSSTSKKQRFTKYDTFVPGPGSYQNKQNSHIPTASILSKKKQQKIQDLPGPGNYEPDYKKLIKSNSGYKLGNAKKIPDQQKLKVKLPGPGQYETAKSTLLGLNNGTTFDPADRKLKLGIESTKTPAPNTYSQTGYYNGSAKNQPKISFAKSQRSFSTNNLMPAPNNYNIRGQFEDSKTKGKGFSLSYRTGSKVELTNKDMPGPGTYQNDSIDKFKKNNPSFSISKSTRLKIDKEKQIQNSPSPYTYEAKSNAFQHKSFTIGNNKRKGLQTINSVPGPGNYDIKMLKDQPSFSVSKSQRQGLAKQRKDQPGPGQYEPKIIYQSKYESIKIGKDHRRTFQDKRQNPGPGSYYKEENKNGGLSFGHEKRLPETKQTFVKNPGPGNYSIPTTISNLPQYVGVKQK